MGNNSMTLVGGEPLHPVRPSIPSGKGVVGYWVAQVSLGSFLRAVGPIQLARPSPLDVGCVGIDKRRDNRMIKQGLVACGADDRTHGGALTIGEGVD